MKKNKKAALWIWRIVTAVTLLGASLVIVIGLFINRSFDQQLPDDFFRLTVKGESPKFYTYRFEDRVNREGTLEEITASTFSQKQTAYISYSDIPSHLINAFIAIEDKRFYEHNGVDWYRTAAAALHYISGSSKQFGGSTITQQLVKNLTGDAEVTMSRKIQEILYARDIERKLDKTQIMELYLNVIHFSDNCDGILAASSHYFSKEPKDLTLSEAATIAAITNSPSYYNPIRYPQHNLERRNVILSQMYEQQYISKEEYENAVNTPIVLNIQDREKGEKNVNSWYIDMVIEDVINDLIEKYRISRLASSQLLYAGGLRIEIAMDPSVQQIAEEYYKTAIRLPSNEKGISAQSAVMILDSRTGDILAVVGAAGEKTGNRVQNFATQTKRPPGSTIKPISVYAPALELGLINWASVYDDVPVNFGESGTMPWPKNATGVYRGLTNIAYAVAHSTNTVAVKVLNDVGVERAYQYAKKYFHLTSLVSESGANDCDVAALALGQLNYGVTLRELTSAYTVFADGGVYHPWRSYFRVLDSEGNILLSCPDRGEVVLSQGNAAIMTKLLQGVVEEGTSSSVTLGRLVECAGKTGTTNQDGDRWFIGYTPDIICGVWCGYEYPEPLEGRNLCTRIWNQIMHSVVEENRGRQKFEIPSSVVRLSYCKDSGLLADEACEYDPRGQRIESGWFVIGSEPKSACSCHILCDYDTVNGGISHGFCPKEHTGKTALIRVERTFPMQIYVSDAQYVYRKDPLQCTPNFSQGQGYFYPELQKYCGVSPVSKPYNRSCIEHTRQSEERDDWDYLKPKQIPVQEE